MSNNSLYGIDIEKVVLASYISEPSLFISSKLEPDTFFFTFHKDLFKTLEKLCNNELPFEEPLIKKELGTNFNDKLFKEIINQKKTINIDKYENILIEFYEKRIINAKLEEITLKLQNTTIPEVKSLLLQEAQNMLSMNDYDLFEMEPISEIQEEQTEYICEDWLPIPRKTVSMIVANGGVGKSWIIIQLALRHLIKNPNEKVFAWLSEDPKGLSKHRAGLISNNILNKNIDDFSNFFVTGSEWEPFHIVEENGELNNKFELMKTKLKDCNIILLDPLIGFYGGNENSNSQARKFMQQFTRWAARENKTIIFIHHADKQGNGSRGASSLVDAVRLVYEIEVIEKNETDRKFKIGKDNYGVSNILNEKEFVRTVFPSSNKNNKRTRGKRRK
ncbi:DnaB domain-containing protein (plasmid) [Campylobacter iguaniorum]|uniref:DnaB domain-containing protein n=1 Tax=Campylobacter iguaniorum TaxID=1244531 RepID=A0A076FI98_9BACT|nr:AAA family ATPase [Campylobacter iguaniorum]AII15594.1 DnaB domain-containing protein [Campylobacter iguaniorum]